MSTLLDFHAAILEAVHDPAVSELLIIARGLGLRRIVCNLMKIYDAPTNLVLLVNATPEEEAAMGELLGIMGCRKPGLRILGYETPKKERQNMYKKGGLMSVTSRILVVDMLQADIPTAMITGMIIMHAEKVTPTSLEAFIVRLFREKNTAGFVKAFSDHPEHITSGLSPLKNIMKELQLRTVHIYPRFHETVKFSLERRRADVIEVNQDMSPAMFEIHAAIVQCMEATLSELKRSNTTLDLDDFNVQNAYFRAFELTVRRQLDPVWHKVGPRTKQLISDLSLLRRLLNYLLTYDSVSFHSYLETLIASNSREGKQNQSPWLLTDAANIMFKTAKARCYMMNESAKKAASQPADNLDDEWAILDEIEGNANAQPNKPHTKRPTWLPKGMDLVLEELPKWNNLAEILPEIEAEIIRQDMLPKKPGARRRPGSDTVLIMTSSFKTSALLNQFLETMDIAAPRGAQAVRMMQDKLRLYLWWKSKLSQRKEDGRGHFVYPDMGKKAYEEGYHKIFEGDGDNLSEAMKLKDKQRTERNASRRRVRGGGPVAGSSRAASVRPDQGGGELQDEAEAIAELLASQGGASSAFFETGVPDMNMDSTIDFTSDTFEMEFDENYGLLHPQETVVVRAYSDDTDDQMLAEIQPRFIIMFEPNLEFIRRIEVYRSSNPGLGVRVYHMIYHLSLEEHKYLAGIRKEKEAFEKLIRERGNMLIPLLEEKRGESANALIKTISSRIAGGQKELKTTVSQVIVDMREFRSTLPSLLHASGLLVIPATLTVGDYVLTPDICVERKSLPDLIQSFTSGRLFTQCELMSVHYKQPVLLIEFEENKAFSLETVDEMKNYSKAKSKYPPKRQQGKGPANPETRAPPSLQSKLVLLTLTFPRVRIIWASSPYATVDIFNDLKMNTYEPDVSKAITIGAEEDSEAGAGVNAAAEELLAALPGITAKNIKYVMSRVRSMRELCDMSVMQVQNLLGGEPGKACWEFMHQGERR